MHFGWSIESDSKASQRQRKGTKVDCVPSKKALRRNGSMIWVTALPTILCQGLGSELPYVSKCPWKSIKGKSQSKKPHFLIWKVDWEFQKPVSPCQHGTATMLSHRLLWHSGLPYQQIMSVLLSYFSAWALSWNCMESRLYICRRLASMPSKSQVAHHPPVNHSQLCIQSPGLAARNLWLSHWLWH